jgi:Anticodon binding domain of methionyl tRNA ligase/CoA binding domain
MSTYRLKNLLSPGSVALVGASPRRVSVGRAVVENIRKAQFDGRFGLVNARYAEIGGVAAVASLDKLPFVPELVVITAPAGEVPGVSRYDGVVPGEGLPEREEADLSSRLSVLLDHLWERHEALALRGTADAVRAIWKVANTYLVERAPWTLLKTGPDRAACAVRTAVNLIGICARAAWPIIPETAEKALAAIGDLEEVPRGALKSALK